MPEESVSPRKELFTSVGLFLATLVSVFLTYGWLWTSGDPLRDADTARDSAMFAGALMSILLAHELGHYFVARRHGFALSLPYFIPVPLAFGTFGAIIRLRSLPANRTALLEMGAAGPLAGLVVAIAALAFGLPDTTPPMPAPLDAEVAALPGWLAMGLGALDSVLTWGPIGWLMEQLIAPPPEGHVAVTIFANPPVMDLLGVLILGQPPGRFDTLSPVALAGWVGCLLTAMNLLPIGQLDGGHIMAGLAPRAARWVSRGLLGAIFIAGIIWMGWAVWAVLLYSMGAFHNLDVPDAPPLTARARVVAVAAVVALGLTFMPSPVQIDSVPLDADGQLELGAPLVAPP